MVINHPVTLLMAHLIQRPNGIYAVQFKDPDRQPSTKRWTLGTRNEPEALHLLDWIQTDLKFGYDPWSEKWDPGWRQRRYLSVSEGPTEPVEESTPLQNGLTFSDAVARYEAHLETDLRKPRTIENASYALQHFGRHLDGDPLVCSIRGHDVHRFLYKANQYKKRTIKEYRGIISRFYGWCIQTGIAAEDPCSEVKVVGKTKKIPKYLMPDEVDLLCQTIRDADASKPRCWRGAHLWLADVVEATVYLALRRSEIAHLEFAHINWLSDPMLLKVAVDEDRGVDTKGSKERVIPVHPRAARVLHRRRKRHGGKGHVFQSVRGKPLRPDHLSHLFQEYRVLAGLPEGITLHSLRHTALSWMAMLGADIETIRLFAGHEDYETSQLYLHVAPRVFRENALGCLDRVDQLRGVSRSSDW